MGLFETLVFYLVIGIGVASAVYLSQSDASIADQALRVGTAFLFWPVYLPLLLTHPPSAGLADENSSDRRTTPDDLDQAITRVEQELDAALKSLDGWAENVLAGEQGRLSELRAAWHLQAERIRELDGLLGRPDFLADTRPVPYAEHTTNDLQSIPDRQQNSLLAREQNIDRLRQVRRQMHDDLLGTLAWVRELVTMIHLAKFTGAPASRAEELISQIAASVEGLSEVTAWKHESLVGSR